VLSSAALVWGWSTAMSVLAGALTALVNLEAVVAFVRRITSRGERGFSVLAAIGLGARYLLLGLALFVIFSVWHADVVAVSIGLSAPVVAVFLEWVLFTIREFGANRDTEQ
jgi:anti-sigma factor RsiW